MLLTEVYLFNTNNDIYLLTYFTAHCGRRGDLVVSALYSELSVPGSRPGRGAALSSWARHFTLTVPLSTLGV